MYLLLFNEQRKVMVPGSAAPRIPDVTPYSRCDTGTYILFNAMFACIFLATWSAESFVGAQVDYVSVYTSSHRRQQGFVNDRNKNPSRVNDVVLIGAKPVVLYKKYTRKCFLSKKQNILCSKQECKAFCRSDVLCQDIFSKNTFSGAIYRTKSSRARTSRPTVR